MVILYVPFFLQALAIFFDEFYFHRRRGLPRWERIGHPLDTLTVVICYAYVALTPYSMPALSVYIMLCIFSCLFITKDEFIHKEACCALENWLHAVLFILHPICFFTGAFIWKSQLDAPFLNFQPVVIGLFMFYQIFYWSYRGEQKSK